MAALADRLAEFGARGTDNSVGVGVRDGVHRAQDSQAGAGDAQAGVSQSLLHVRPRMHPSTLSTNLEPVKSREARNGSESGEDLRP